ncbi:MAG: deoxyguanosinetriphosphate triphosphohydrolase [Oscillospiraceae bacterium]|nr:deoxyguanosinetriphosphate triphosphohydrolase [Oscillospiraceae bacterium]
MTISEMLCALERETLSRRAAFADEARRARPEPPCELRTPFQRDRDRILHSGAFRRLKHKTQVFLSPEGDHYRTRLTHTLEVAQIARTIARALRLNEDLTEAVALGHDLGHTPFGHAGERALDGVFPFRHYEQSLRVADKLEKNGSGLNLTQAVRNGIERHTNGPLADTLEGQIVRLADRIAYINHDIDDAVRAGVLVGDDIPPPIQDALGRNKSARVNTLVRACVEASSPETCTPITLTPEIAAAFDALHGFMFAQVYTNPLCKSEEGKAIDMITWLYHYFVTHADLLPGEYQQICQEEGPERASVDYIAGMTDRFAVHTFEGCFVPKGWGIL